MKMGFYTATVTSELTVNVIPVKDY